MLFLALLYFSIQTLQSSSAIPVPDSGWGFSTLHELLAPHNHPTNLSDSSNNTICLDGIPFKTNYRSTRDIVWTCWLTIFACTWVSVHPNVWGYGSTWKQRALRRVELMVWALIAPELTVIWAFRQWMGARQIEAEFQKIVKEAGRGTTGHWSIVHSHFLQMGGYIFQTENGIEYVRPGASYRSSDERELRVRAIRALLDRNETREDLEDRSKGDALLKVSVALQVLWFVAQYVARTAQGLAAAEIELTTLASCALNLLLYIFWWNKPLDVQRPIVVVLCHEKSIATDSESHLDASVHCGSSLTATLHKPETSVEATVDDEKKPGDVAHSVATCTDSLQLTTGTPETGAEPTHTSQESPRIDWWTTLWQSAHSLFRSLGTLVLWLLSLIVMAPLAYIADRLYRLLLTDSLPASTSLPTFYAASPILSNSASLQFAGVLISALFGAIRGAAWFWTFSNPLHRQLWRIAAMFLACAPLVLLLTLKAVKSDLGVVWGRYLHRRLANIIANSLMIALVVIIIVAILLYIPARLVLIVISIIELRHLPSSTHQTVEWADVFPHL